MLALTVGCLLLQLDACSYSWMPRQLRLPRLSYLGYCPQPTTLGTFGSLWFPLGCPWAPFWPSFGVPLIVLGHLWDPFGAPWAALGRLLEIGRNFPSKCSPFAMPAHKNKPPGIHILVILVIQVPRVPRKWCHEVLLGAPLPHAPGVRMT